jgi:hypothetical protein
MPTISFEELLPQPKKQTLKFEEIASGPKVASVPQVPGFTPAERTEMESRPKKTTWEEMVSAAREGFIEAGGTQISSPGEFALKLPGIATRVAAKAADVVAPRLGNDIQLAADTLAVVSGQPTGGLPKLKAPLQTAEAAPLEAPAAKVLAEDIGAPTRATISEATGPAKAGNINLNKVAAPEEVKQTYRDTAKANDEFTAARRGTISFERTREMADLVGMTPEKLSARIKGQAFNAEQMLSARNLLVQQATKVSELAKTAYRGSDADKLAFSEELTRLVAAQEQVSGATAEAGRALSQFRMLAGASKEQIARFVDAAKQGGKLDDVIERINTLDDPAQIAKFASQAFKATTSDKLLEIWINSLLSGPQTHVTNMLSNSLVSLWSVPERAAAAGVSKFTGSGIRFGEAPSKLFGMLEGAREGLRAGWRTFKTEEPSDFASKIEARRYRSISGRTGRTIRIPGRALMAEDELFKAIGYRGEINALAYRQASKEGLAGPARAQRIAELRASPTEAMQNAARNAAEVQTFTNPLGEGGKTIQMFANAHPWAKVIIPFVRTPVNIVKFAAHRSPFAPLFKDIRAELAGAKGPIARDEAVARIGFGSSVGALAGYMAAQGLITGQGPDEPKARGIMYQSGWQPYSFKIGDNYYSFSRLEPLAMLLGVSADFVELAKYATDEEAKSVAALIMGSLAKNVTSKTFLSGLSSLIEAIQDPDRYGQQYIQQMTGTVVPTGVAQVAKVTDPYLREARTVLENIKSRIPGLRQTLPAKRDLYGQPIKLEGSLGPDLLSPIYQSTAKNDPVLSELLRLKMYPGRPLRSVRGVELSADEFSELQTTTGGLTKTVLTRLMAAPGWAKISDDAKRDLIQKALIRVRAAGRKTIIPEGAVQ